MANNFAASNENGATIIEASFILPIVLMFSLFIILLSVHIFSIYSTYYACFQSLKSASTGPRVIASSGTVDPQPKSVEFILNKELYENLNSFKTGVSIDDVIVRNQFGCFKLNGGTKVIKDGCINTENTLRITPNSWVTLEVPVRPINIKIFNIKLPAVNVRSTTRMYDWLS